jgi:hypothetical protein
MNACLVSEFRVYKGLGTREAQMDLNSVASEGLGSLVNRHVASGEWTREKATDLVRRAERQGDGADVYYWRSRDGVIELACRQDGTFSCRACALQPRHLTLELATADDAGLHLCVHRRHCHAVDEDAFSALSWADGCSKCRPTATVEAFPETPGVYAITFDWKYFKVGRADNIKRRVYDLQIASPLDLKLLRVLSDNPTHESRWHKVLDDFHVRGEWFRLTDESMALIGLGVTDG